MTCPRTLSALLAALLALLTAAPLLAQPAPPRASMLATAGGVERPMPLLRTDITADVRGDLAEVIVRQRYSNDRAVPVEATWLFPLHHDAAVHAMTMQVGERVVVGRIERVEQARAQWEEARRQGQTAAVLTEHRPNVFSQRLANVLPGQTVEIELRYVYTVDRRGGTHQLVIPLVVGPRYEPARPAPEAGDAPSPGAWKLNAPLPTAPVALPADIDPERVGVTVELRGALPLAEASSPFHALAIDKRDPRWWSLTLASGRTVDNRDLVIDYRFEAATTAAGAMAFRDHRGGFFALQIEPPAILADAAITPRELVFVLDCSGSMRGMPLQASQTFVARALQHLRPTDTFRLIRFSNDATGFSRAPVPATADNIQRGITYVMALQAVGGTEMIPGIRQALDPPIAPGALRIVTFLTDGYIGNDASTLALLHERIGQSRLFALGVGTSVNRFLLTEFGRIGRGQTRFIDPTDDPTTTANAFADAVETPVLTDIRIDWGGLEPTDLVPRVIPDLFAGQPLRIMGRFDRPGAWPITVHGLVRGAPATLPVTLELPEAAADGEQIATLWARAAITDLQRELMLAGLDRTDPAQHDARTLEDKITRLGLTFGLVTPWTTFVAIDVQGPRALEPTNRLAVTVPLPAPAGTTGTPGVSHPLAFAGHGTPEPATIGLLLLVAMAGGLGALWRRGRT